MHVVWVMFAIEDISIGIGTVTCGGQQVVCVDDGLMCWCGGSGNCCWCSLRCFECWECWDAGGDWCWLAWVGCGEGI